MNRANVIGPSAAISARRRSTSSSSSPTASGSGSGIADEAGHDGGRRCVGHRRPLSAYRTPGPTRLWPPRRIGTSAAAADAVRSRSHGSRTRSARSRSLANRSSGGGHPRSSAPRRWARSTRVSMRAPSASARRAGPATPGPSRSSSSPEDAAGRPAVRAAERRPDAAVRRPALLDQRPRPRPGVRLEPAQVGGGRPTGDEQLGPGIGGKRPEPRAAASRTGRCIGRRRGPAGGARRGTPSSSSRSSGESRSIASRRRARRSRTGHAGDLREPAGQRVVGRQVGQVPQRVAARRRSRGRPPMRGGSRARPAPRPRRPGRTPPRSAAVASGIEPAPSTTRPSGRSSATRRRSRAPNGVSSGGSRRTMTRAAPAARNPARWCSASAVLAASSARSSGPASGRELGGEDQDRDRGHV